MNDAKPQRTSAASLNLNNRNALNTDPELIRERPILVSEEEYERLLFDIQNCFKAGNLEQLVNYLSMISRKNPPLSYVHEEALANLMFLLDPRINQNQQIISLICTIIRNLVIDSEQKYLTFFSRPDILSVIWACVPNSNAIDLVADMLKSNPQLVDRIPNFISTLEKLLIPGSAPFDDLLRLLLVIPMGTEFDSLCTTLVQITITTLNDNKRSSTLAVLAHAIPFSECVCKMVVDHLPAIINSICMDDLGIADFVTLLESLIPIVGPDIYQCAPLDQFVITLFHGPSTSIDALHILALASPPAPELLVYLMNLSTFPRFADQEQAISIAVSIILRCPNVLCDPQLCQSFFEILEDFIEIVNPSITVDILRILVIMKELNPQTSEVVSNSEALQNTLDILLDSPDEETSSLARQLL